MINLSTKKLRSLYPNFLLRNVRISLSVTRIRRQVHCVEVRSGVNKDWIHKDKDKDKDQTLKDQD